MPDFSVYKDWWWKIPEEMALWQKLNSLTDTERISAKYKEICQAKIREYGQIYFFKPYPSQQPILTDTATVIYVHGNNSSGKSYACAARTAYEVIGWSPYVEVPPTKYGFKLVWAFSPSFDIQRTSSQVHLFSTDSPTDIGLLPSFEAIEKRGGKVQWGTKHCLDFVRLWDNTVLEFKSAEMKSKNLQASGIDFVWFDEAPDATMHDEIIARIFRKRGRMVMSFIVEDVSENYLVTDVYERFLKGDKRANFHFLDVEGNLSLTAEDIETYKSRVREAALSWRFSPHGKFTTLPKGSRVFPPFSETLHVTPELLRRYDPLRILWRSWDIGWNGASCVGAQLTREGNINILFAVLVHDKDMIEFLNSTDSYCKEKFPELHGLFDVLPHDAARHSPQSRLTVEDIFRDKGFNQLAITYTKREAGFAICNEKLSQLRDKRALVQIDADEALPLIQTLAYYTVDEETQKPKKDNHYEHVADAFKQLISYLHKSGGASRQNKVEETEPGYFQKPFSRRDTLWLQ